MVPAENDLRISAVAIASSGQAATSSGSYPALVSASAPIAYYRLDDTTSKMTDSGVHDLSGTYGSAVKHDGAGLLPNVGALSTIFPGSPAGADISTATGTVTANALFASARTNLTVEAWIKPQTLNTTNAFVPIVSYGREVQGQAWVIGLSAQSTLNFWMKTAGGSAPSYFVKSTTILRPAQTFHVVATYDGNTVKLYLNGKMETSVPASGSIDYSAIAPNFGLAIGGALGGKNPIFNGSASDVAIYPAALSASAIANHFAVGTAVAPSPAPLSANDPYAALIAAGNPLAMYTLRDSGSTMADESVNKRNGVYGAGVHHGTAALTSTGQNSSTFAGAAGSNIAANTGTVPPNSILEKPSTGLTVEAWIEPADFNRTTNYVPLVAFGREIIGNVWALEITPQSALTFYLKVADTSYAIKPVSTMMPYEIYHLVATYDGSTLRLYINGSLAGSTPAHGSLNYTGLSEEYGLAVGGALGGTLPVFNGSISDVAIYSSALSAAQVEKHYLVGEIATAVQERPTTSDTFVNSIGVVTHLRSTGSPYTASFPAFESMIKASGIRHIGDALAATPSWYPQELAKLAADGIHASLITGLTQTAAEIRQTIPLFNGSIEAIEGPNEPDISGDTNWVNDTRAFQAMLWSTVKNDASTAYLDVVGPSMVTLDDALALGNISPTMNVGSIHNYFNGFNPGTAGWGSLSQYGIYGSIPWDLGVSAIVSGTHKSLSTETGYSDLAGNTGSVDSRTLARYVPRIYLEHFLHGIPRTTLYEFYDEPGTGRFANFGLVSATNQPKTSYYALKSLIAALADPGSPFTPQPLRYVLTGNVDNLHHLLLQKRDGTYQLLLWLEVSSFDPTTKTDLTVPSQTVLIEPSNAPETARLDTLGDTGARTTKYVNFNDGTVAVSVDDHVTIVSFK